MVRIPRKAACFLQPILNQSDTRQLKARLCVAEIYEGKETFLFIVYKKLGKFSLERNNQSNAIYEETLAVSVIILRLS